MNKHGQQIMIGLMFFLLAIILMAGFIEPIKTALDGPKRSYNLNCDNYQYETNASHPYSYNSSLETDDLGCVGLSLFIPFLILAILIGGLTKLLSGNFFSGGRQEVYGGY